MVKKLKFITGNAAKAEQLSKYLGIPVLREKLDLTEIQSLDLTEVVKHKTLEAFKKVKSPVLVDDVSLVANALGKLPGPFVKYFLSELGTDGICKLVSGYKDKSAVATVAIGYYDGKNLKVFDGTIEGSVSEAPSGTNGFGWDAIFMPIGYKETRGQMNEKDYDNTSPRKLALKKLENYLKKLN